MILEALEGALSSIPIYFPAAALRGHGSLALVLPLVTGALIAILATRRRVLSITTVESGGTGIPFIVFARIMSCMAILLPIMMAHGVAGIDVAGRLTMGNLALMSLGALAPDLVVANMMAGRGRRGLALIALLNVPITGVVWTHLALSAALLASRARWSPGRGIVIGTVRAAITHGVRTIRGREEDIRSIETDWFVDDRFGPFQLVWSPRQENGEHNPHVVVAGRSGAGKSTFLYHLILGLLAHGCGVTVIDMTGQYVKYAKLLADHGLGWIAKSMPDAPDIRSRPPGSPRVRILPIVIRGFEIIGEEPIPEIVSSQLTYSLSLVDRMALGSNQQYFLSEAVSRASLRAGREGRVMRLSDVVEELDELIAAELMDPAGKLLERDTYEAIRGLSRRLSLLSLYLEPDGKPARAIETVAAGCSGRHAEDEPHEWGELVVLDLSPIPDEEVRVIASELVLKKLFWTVKRRLHGHTVRHSPWFLVVDEAWKLLASGLHARPTVLVDFFREARNYGIGVVALTQHLTDLGKEAYNASLQVFLAVTEPSELERLAKRITARGAEQLEELLTRLKPHQSVVRVEVPVERIARVSRYRGAAVEWVVAELRRLYIPRELMERINRLYVERYLPSCEAAVASRRERRRPAQPDTPQEDAPVAVAQAPAATARTISHGASRIRVSLAGVGRAELEPAPVAPQRGTDPLDELSDKASADRVAAVAAALAVANRWMAIRKDARTGRFVVRHSLPHGYARALAELGLMGSSGLKVGFLRTVYKIENDRHLRALASEVARSSCPSCLKYPVDRDHSCGGVDS